MNNYRGVFYSFQPIYESQELCLRFSRSTPKQLGFMVVLTSSLFQTSYLQPFFDCTFDELENYILFLIDELLDNY